MKIDEEDYWWVLLYNLVVGGVMVVVYKIRLKKKKLIKAELRSDSEWITEDNQEEFTEKDKKIYTRAYYKGKLKKGLPYRQLRGYLGKSNKGLIAKSRRMITERLERGLSDLDEDNKNKEGDDSLINEKSQLTEYNLINKFGKRQNEEFEEGSIIGLDNNPEFAYGMNSELDSEILSRRDFGDQLDSESYSEDERGISNLKKSYLFKRNDSGIVPMADPSFSPLDYMSPRRIAKGITPAYEREVLQFIKKVTTTNQTEEVEEFKVMKPAGKASWRHTHFIFMIDCSGSMKGARWDAVKFGYMICLDRIKAMSDVVVSAFTFDTVPNPFCKERSPKVAIGYSRDLPFTGRGTNYKRALRYAISLIKKSVHKNYLFCLMFLSDGLGGFSEEPVKELKEMKKDGKKILFYTVAFKTSRDQEMLKMASILQGEHYKVTNIDAAKIIFSTILSV